MISSTSWKTTIAGLLSGLGVAADAILQAIQSGAFTGKTGIQLVIAIGLVLFGVFAKDKNVTGGTVVNSTNNSSVVQTSANPITTTAVPDQPIPVVTQPVTGQPVQNPSQSL